MNGEMLIKKKKTQLHKAKDLHRNYWRPRYETF